MEIGKKQLFASYGIRPVILKSTIDEVRKSVMANMRKLARLYLQFRNVKGQDAALSDMLHRENFQQFQAASCMTCHHRSLSSVWQHDSKTRCQGYFITM